MSTVEIDFLVGKRLFGMERQKPHERAPSADAAAPVACRGFALRRHGASSRKGAGLPMPLLVLFDQR